MAKYEVQWVRVEHRVWTLDIEAEDRDEAYRKAREFARSTEFNNIIEDYEITHADEFVNDIDEVE